MKHYFKFITLLFSLLLVFSVSFSILAEPTTSLEDYTSSQDTTSKEQSESGETKPSDDTSSESTSSDDVSSENTPSGDTPSEQPPADDTPIIIPPAPEYDPDNEALFGTKEDGIILPEGSDIWSVPRQLGLKNYNFSEGLKYWASLNDKKPSDVVLVKTEGDNSFLTLNNSEIGDGIISAPFLSENILPGQAAVLIYDWSGSRDFMVTLEQYDSSGSSLVSSGFGKTLYKAKNDQEWNTNATKPIHPVRISNDGYNAVYFVVKITIYNPTADTKIDNLRIGYSNANGIIYDVNGNEIKGEARTSNQSEAPVTEYKPPITDDCNHTDQALERGGDNEDLINVFIVLGTVALCAILILLPSAIVKASNKRKSKTKKIKFKDFMNENDFDV